MECYILRTLNAMGIDLEIDCQIYPKQDIIDMINEMTLKHEFFEFDIISDADIIRYAPVNNNKRKWPIYMLVLAFRTRFTHETYGDESSEIEDITNLFENNSKLSLIIL